MPIRRTLLTAFCLSLFGASVYGLQDGDPFGQWDSKPAKPAAKSGKSTVTWFSPTSGKPAEGKTESDSTSDAAESVIPMRERITVPGKPGTPSPVAGKADSSKPAATTDSGSGSKPSKSQEKPSAARTASAEVKPDSGVKSAAFVPAEESRSGKKIRQVSHPVPEDANPFAEYLEENTGSGNAAASKAEAPPEFSKELSEGEEQAEVLVPARPKQKPASPATTGTARLPVAKPKSKSPTPAPTVVPAKTVSHTPARPAVTGEDAGPQSPGVTVQWVRHGDFNVGQECAVDLVVTNSSKSVVRSVMTEAVIPENVQLAEAKPAAMAGADVPTWTFGEMKPGESRTVSIRMIPQERGDVRLDAFVRLTGSSSSSFSVQEPLIEVEVTGPETAEIGQQVAYVVRVNNPGTGIATNVVVQASVPEGLEHRDGALPSIEIGTLNPGESRQAKLNLTAVHGGEHQLAVRAVAEGGLNMESFASVSIAEPELEVAITGPEEQLAGRTADYVLSVSNLGNVQSSNVRTKYRIPDGLEFVAANRGGKYIKAEHSIEWFVGTVQPDESSDFKLTLRAVETGEMVHKAGVRTEHGQTWICDHVTAVEGTASLELQIAASDPNLQVGEEVTWTVTIRNSGARAATNVGMSCELPSGIQLVEADGPSENIAENGVMVFRSIPAIEPGEEAVYTIVGSCQREGNHRLRLRVASESISDPLIGEETATVSAQ